MQKMYKPPCPTESAEQQLLFKWAAYEARARYPCLTLLFAIPNGGKRSERTGAVMKAEGVKRGVPDIMLPVSRGVYHGLFIELKRQRGGQVSHEQRDWLDALAIQGYRCHVCRGFEEAKRAILDYMAQKDGQED